MDCADFKVTMAKSEYKVHKVFKVNKEIPIL
jgi:hypothetical protein